MNTDGAKVALITGAGSGIGAAAARLFAERGERVVAADVNEEGGAATVAAIEQAGGEAIFVRADVSNSAEVEAMVTAAVERFGRLDHAFNNAGIEGAPAPLADLDEAAWDHLIAVNLKSVFLCMKSEIPAMLANGGGAIVNTSSVAGLVGFAGSAAYVASKHGVVGLTKSAALDYAAAGIRINAVCPGVIETPMITRALAGQPALEAGLKAAEPVGRFGAPIEIAEAAHWLCSDASSFLTAQAIAVDGGFTAQ
jgi:NAD(P)-dependent dehydrogenase (short-subunit alcohol dehydrogenase family)